MQKENEKIVQRFQLPITTWLGIENGVVYVFMKCPACGSANGVPLSALLAWLKRSGYLEKSVPKQVAYIT